MTRINQYDIGIVGAGPIGGYIASELSKSIESVALFEQHKTIGIPMNCAGLVTPRVFDLFSIPRKSIIQNEIKGAHIHSPSGHILSIGGEKVHAVCIDRTLFDKYLVDKAKKQNTNLFLSEKILSIQTEKDKVELTTSTSKKINCTCLIGADGPFSKVRDLCGFPQPKRFLRGMGAKVDNMSLNPEYVEIFVGEHIAPGFFAWMIPISRDGIKARIGLCIPKDHKHSPNKYFQKMFNEFPLAAYLKNAEIIEKTGGVIPLGPLPQTVKNNIMLVGDAAAQVKPTSGGGIYPGLLSAKYCVEYVRKAFSEEGFSTEILQQYHQAWKQDIGKELSMGMQFRKIYSKLDNSDFDKYIQKFNTPSILKTIVEKGDIDYPSRLLTPLLKKLPSLLRLLPRMI
jgi:geranylgeranyl reductase family protein